MAARISQGSSPIFRARKRSRGGWVEEDVPAACRKRALRTLFLVPASSCTRWRCMGVRLSEPDDHFER